jgi:hypothetical protein
VFASIWPFRRTLAKQRWATVTIDHMHLAFLTAEFRDISGTTPADADLIKMPNLDDTAQNHRRRELLYSRRGPLLKQIPASTEWFEVQYLERWHLHQLRAINHRYWTSSGVDDNELLKVARRMRITLLLQPREWAPPVLWGHTKQGPLTILEGNNRLVAYAAVRHRLKLGVRVYVGLSEEPCCWHPPDRL